jgi:hypothetical protein
MASNATHTMESNSMHPLLNGNAGASDSNNPGDPNIRDVVKHESLEDIKPMSRVWGKYGFGLAIQQQPKRARMCGFGDKVRLSSYNIQSGH